MSTSRPRGRPLFSAAPYEPGPRRKMPNTRPGPRPVLLLSRTISRLSRSSTANAQWERPAEQGVLEGSTMADQNNGKVTVVERKPVNVFDQLEHEMADMRRHMQRVFRWPFAPLPEMA